MIIDALGAYSKDYVTPAYYNKVLNRGDVQDSDSAEILDLIFSSRVYDLGQVFGGKWATTDIIGVLDHKIEERVERQKAFVEDNIASTVEKIKENG